MKSFLGLITGLFLVCLWVGGAGAVELKPSPTRECAICHFRWMEPFYYEERGTPLHPLQVNKVAGTEMMCFSCHDGSTEDSRVKVWLRDRHKVNVKPSKNVRIPKIFPLSPDGKIVCSTCHSAHGVPTDTSIERVIFLRISNNDSIMCELCHVQQTKQGCNHPIHTGDRPIPKKLIQAGAVLSVTNPKHVICESCHTAHGGIEKNFILRVSDSTLCSTCHPKKRIETEPKLVRRKNHPLFVKFHERHGAIKLYAGRQGTVQCISCHKVHQPKAKQRPYKLLAAPIVNSQLCLLCHYDKAVPGKNHPIRVAFKPSPGNKIKFFTGPKGTLQCLTCHGIHQQKDHPHALVAERSPLCRACHARDFWVEKTDHDLRITAPKEKNVIGEDLKTGGVCSACHIPHKATGPYLWARKIGKKNPTPSDLCQTCHREGGIAKKKTVGRYTHPVNVAMKEKPAGLPLFKVGKEKDLLECATCHNPHQWRPGVAKKGPGKNTEGTENTSFLRKPNLKYPRLCGTCHYDKAYVTGTDHDLRITAPNYVNLQGKPIKKSSPCTACHGVHQAKEKVYLWVAPLGKGQDYIEQTCYGCHSKNGPAADKTVPVGSHPTKLYFGYHKKYLSLVLVKNIPLFTKDGRESVKGEISCATCHDPHIWDDTNPMRVPWKNIEGNITNSFLRKRLHLMENFCSICHGPSALFLFRFYHDKEMREELHRHKIPLIQRLR